MPRFNFTAIDTSGKERTGTVEAPSLDLATTQVKSMGLFPIHLGEQAAPAPRAASRRRAIGASGVKARKPVVFGSVVTRKGLTVFTRQLATLTQAGLPLLRGLEVLSRQERNPGFKWVIEQLADNIRTGNTLSEGLAQHPKVFDRLYVNMVRAGEAGGVLDVVLSRLARFMEKAEKIKGKVKAAMVYPIIVICVTVVILSALMVWVVPQFKSIYKDLLKGAELPALTKMVLGIADMMREQSLLTALILGGVVGLFVMARRHPRAARGIDWFAFHGPLFGELARKAAIARFARTLGTLLSSGVPILNALLITRDTSGNTLLHDAINLVHDRVKEGEGIAGPLDQTKVFDGMVTSMIDVGEETGELFEMLNRIADTYEEEVDNTVAALTSIIEPVMIVLLAIVVGINVIALFLPIKDIIQRMQ